MTIKQTVFRASLLAVLGSEAAAQTPGLEAPQQADCPEFVRGSTLVTAEIHGGVQVTITTSAPGRVQLLRAMIHDTAGYIESKERPASATRSDEETPQASSAPLVITVTDVSGGASVKLTATHEGGVRALREDAKKLEQLWSADECINGGLMRA